MQKTKLLLAALGAMFALPVLAEDAAATKHKEDVHVIPASAHTVTGNVGLFSQYIYRGLTQTNEKPALQGGFDYAHSSGLYAGVWGSNVSWVSDPCSGTIAPAALAAGNCGSASLELDTYAGFKGGFAGDFSYDIGFLRYNYPGSYPAALPAGTAKPDTDEIYGALGYKWITAKYSYSLGNTFGIAESHGTDYLDISANYTLPDTGITLGAHVGRQGYKGANAAYWVADPSCTNKCLTYTDYKLSVSKDFSGYVVGLAFTGTNAKALTPNGAGAVWQNAFGKNIGRSETVLSLVRSF